MKNKEWLRGDGVPVTLVDHEAIKLKVERAEYAAMHICQNTAIFIQYYGDDLGRDFRSLLEENKMLRNKLSDLTYEMESKE